MVHDEWFTVHDAWFMVVENLRKNEEWKKLKSIAKVFFAFFVCATKTVEGLKL